MNKRIPLYPWLYLIILTLLLFLIIGHELDFSLRERFDASGEAFEEMIREGNPLRRIGLAVLGVLSVFILFRHRNLRQLSLPDSLGMMAVLFLSWSLLSVIWSIDPLLTIRRLMVLVVFWLAAIALSSNLSIRYLTYFVLLSTGSNLILGLAAEGYLGTFQPFNPGYRFAGTFHPNVQGESCALLFLAAAVLLLTARRFRAFLWVIISVALMAMILTRSRTSFVSALLALFIFYTVVTPRSLRKMIVMIVMLFLAVVVVFLSMNFFDNNWSLISSGIHLGRDTYTLDTLNGRIKIWNLCLQFVRERPLIGHGYEGFWNLTHIYQLSSLVGWGLKSAHSAYIELLLHVGLLGFLAFMGMLLLGLKNALKRFTREHQAGYGFLFMLIVFFLLQGLLESRLAQMGYGTFLLIWGISSLAFLKPGTLPELP